MDIQRNQNPEIEVFVTELIDMISEAFTADFINSKLKLWYQPLLQYFRSFLLDDMVLGLENEVKIMIQRLKDENPRHDVIRIIGPVIFNHPPIKENFPCCTRIWLLQRIIDQFSPLPPPPTAIEDNRPRKMILRDLAIRTYNHLKTNPITRSSVFSLGVLNSCRFIQFKELLIGEGLMQPPRKVEERLNDLINKNLV
ncbi:hypothetical protein NE237_009856 [Protea cynaroides]|uniref:Uncharacterized protein n=1 Tax=Protea cynaroides TaxID=273540 RepID=A0A9Q0KYL2_9MAGN|nr:hypothetical protein NE237_009856 [Protea cynaroides]